MTARPSPAEALADAAIRVAQCRGRPVVVKLGGSAMEEPAATTACLRSVAALRHLGVNVVVVHGGGKPIDRAMAAAGLTPKKVAGRRYTDDATLAIVVNVLIGISRHLAAELHAAGCHANAFDGENFPLRGGRLVLAGPDGPTDLGRVGTVSRVATGTFDEHFAAGVIPVVPSLALDGDGGWLNVNADTAASAVAGALKADRAVFLTDTPGVLRDRADPASLVPKLTEAGCRGLIASGVIDGGMVPKVEACFEALDAGAKAALILDGRVPYSLLEVFTNETFTGTEITR